MGRQVVEVSKLSPVIGNSSSAVEVVNSKPGVSFKDEVFNLGPKSFSVLQHLVPDCRGVPQLELELNLELE